LSYEVAKFDYSRRVGGRIGHERENPSLARLVKRVELNRVLGKLAELFPPDVRDIREAARGEEDLERHSPAGIPFTPGQHLVLEPPEAMCSGRGGRCSSAREGMLNPARRQRL
jgi:hypothetical protein